MRDDLRETREIQNKELSTPLRKLKIISLFLYCNSESSDIVKLNQ